MERRSAASMRECLRLLRQFADGHISLGEFEPSYWTERSRCVPDADIHTRFDSAVRGFEQDLSRYVPDPLPQIRNVEERELRRRALRALQAIDDAGLPGVVRRGPVKGAAGEHDLSGEQAVESEAEAAV